MKHHKHPSHLRPVSEFSIQEHRLHPQHLPGGSQLTVAPVPEDPMPYSDLHGHQVYMHAKHIYVKKTTLLTIYVWQVLFYSYPHLCR